jgi:hypothetical protein
MICTACHLFIESGNLTKVNRMPYHKKCGKKKRRKLAKTRRREREEVYRLCGLKKVRGALGGTYWE